MNRRDFLKTAIATAAATQVTSVVAQEAPKFNKVSSLSNGPQVARRTLRNTDISVPLLGYGMMRLPTKGDQITKRRKLLSNVHLKQASTISTPPISIIKASLRSSAATSFRSSRVIPII